MSDFSALSSDYDTSAEVMDVPHKPTVGPYRGELTTTGEIHVVIDELSAEQTGGSPILSYQIDYDRGSGSVEWQELKGFSANDNSLFYVKDGLTINTEYRVRYRAKNIFGWSEHSDVTSIFTIMVPDIIPGTINTELIGTLVVFTWSEPDERGSSINEYNVRVKTHTGDYYLHAEYCSQMSSETCSIPMSVLYDVSGPYQLPLNTLIQAIVSASNL